MEKNIGIFICGGCDIAGSIDLESLSNTVQTEFKLKICKLNGTLCSNEFTSKIQSDIENEKLDSVIVAACSSRHKNKEFAFGKNIITERVNLRELVSWCSEPNAEDTQMLAEDYLRMGITRVQNIGIPKPYIAENLSSDILVVGAGITGINAAIEAAKAGYKIHLIEKEPVPGGWSKELYRQLPTKSPYVELQKPVIHDKIEEIKKYPNISLSTSTVIKEISGQPGDFIVSLDIKGKEEIIKIATIISATGWKPYDAGKLEKYGYGKYQNVLTNVEFEKFIKSGKQPPKNILFIQCAGSRDKEHLPYCSNFCCGTSLKQATYVREKQPDSMVYVIYKDIRTPGHYEFFYKEVQKDNRIFLTKGEIQSVVEENGELLVTINNTLIGEEVTLKVDMVVLATGMTPAGSEELNLKYRLGKGMPELKYNFPDSHFICFPYETRRTGIYAAGTSRAPMDIASCMEDAAGAALKAIQCLEAVKTGKAVHPRSGDISYPQMYMERCTDCKRCTEECPFGMYDENEKGTPLPNPNRCRRCGICMGSCPERVISFEDFSINSVSAVIKSVNIPDEFDEKPRILAFVCENDAYPALDMAGFKRYQLSPYVRIIPVRCLGSINKVWISDALSHGYDGIMQIGCKPGDNYQCHFIQGSQLTEVRGENLQETLTSMMLEEERIRTEFVEINDYDKIFGMINDYVETIKEIGPNPFKSL